MKFTYPMTFIESCAGIKKQGIRERCPALSK